MLGRVVQMRGNVQVWKLLSGDICTEPWMLSEAHGDSHPHSDTQRGSDTLPRRHGGFPRHLPESWGGVCNSRKT